jgi:hypothetical protein
MLLMRVKYTFITFLRFMSVKKKIVFWLIKEESLQK